MKYHWEDRKRVSDVRGMGLCAHVSWFLGAVFAVLGIIGDAANITLGLEPASWLLLAIVTFLAGMPFFMGVGVAWYLRTKEAKDERKK